jgi:hypothetical protein
MADFPLAAGARKKDFFSAESTGLPNESHSDLGTATER